MSYHQYLVAVTVANSHADKVERTIYRVSPEAPLKSVVENAVLRCELPGPLRCTKIEVLGNVEPHLFNDYLDLLHPLDASDQVPELDNNCVICFRPDEFCVYYGGRLCSPRWRARGPATAYLNALRTGARKPEYSR